MLSRTGGIRLLSIESFNGRLRDECLNELLFTSLRHARQLIATWRYDYNHARPLRRGHLRLRAEWVDQLKVNLSHGFGSGPSSREA